MSTTELDPPAPRDGLTWHEHGRARRPGVPIWRESDMLLTWLMMVPFLGVALAMLGLLSWMVYRDYLAPGAEGGNPTIFCGVVFLIIVLGFLGASTVSQMNRRWLLTVSPEMLRGAAGDSDDIERRIAAILDSGEQVLWARRLSASGRLAGGAELLTSQRALQIIGTHHLSIPWGEASRVTLKYGRGRGCHLSVIGPPVRGQFASNPDEIVFGRCADGAAVEAALRYVLAPARPGVPMAGSAAPAQWAPALGRVLVEGESAVWTGRPQRPYLLTVIDRLAGLRHMSRLIPLLVLSAIVMFVLPIAVSSSQVDARLPPIELAWAVWVAALWLFFVRPTDRATLYVLTNRRAFQLHVGRLTGRTEAEFYPRLDSDLFRVQPPRLAALLSGGTNLVLAVERRADSQHEITLRDLPEFEAMRALSLLQGLYGARRSGRPTEFGRTPAVSWEHQLGPQALARVKALLGKGEQVLWAGQAHVTDLEQPLSLRAYLLTDRRAIVSASESFARANSTLSWGQIRRVKIEQRAGGSGTLTLAAPPTRADLDERTCVFKRCPEIGVVRQVVERQLLGETTAGATGALEFEGVRESTLGAAVPEAWRSEVAGALLDGEQAQWIGRADARTVSAIWRQGLAVGLVIVGIIAVIAFFAGNYTLAGGAIVGGGLLAWGAQVMIRRMVELAYVITDRRALQVGGMGVGGRRSVEFYPGVGQARIWSSIDAAYDQVRGSGPGCADVHVSDLDAGNERRTSLVSFVAVLRNEVPQVSELLGAAYGVPAELRIQRDEDPGQDLRAILSTLPEDEDAGGEPAELPLGHWPSWRWALLSGLILALSGGLALLALLAERPWLALGIIGVVGLLSGTQLWRHGIVLLRGLNSAVTLSRVPISPGQRTRATVSVRGRGAIAPLRVTLVCRGRVHDRKSTTEHVLHEQLLAEVDRLELRGDAVWQQALAVSIPADAPRSRAPEGDMVVRRQRWEGGYPVVQSFRRVRNGGKTRWKKLDLQEADFEWVTWSIEVQANGGWGARWVAFTHSYPFTVE